MKGLILKDILVLIREVKFVLLIIPLFMVMQFFEGDNLIFSIYPCMFSGLLPITLMSYEDNDRWLGYSATLPYTKAELVSAKYIIWVGLSTIIFTVTILLQLVRTACGQVLAMPLGELAAVLLMMSYIPGALSCPFIFKLGVQKGRLAFFIVVCIACSLGALFTVTEKGSGLLRYIPPVPSGIVLLLFVIGSWLLSIKLFKTREL